VTPTKILLAFSAMTALLMVFAIQRLPGDERIEIPNTAPPVQTSVVTKTADPIRIIETVRPVATERIVPDAPVKVVPPVKMVSPIEQDEQPVARQRSEQNVCTRHGMKKVITRGGRSWRCRR
jgi:hypothetical protein